ncbi:MAG: hypothetical protein ACK4VN_06990 [Bacteroidales bacterium]
MANKKLKNFEYASHSEPGKLTQNVVDESAFFETPNGAIFLICNEKPDEGAELLPEGKSFARIASERIRYYLENEWVENPDSAVYNALIYANGFIYEYSRKNAGERGPAQLSCSLVLVRENKIFYSCVGNARILFFNGRRVYVLSDGFHEGVLPEQQAYLGSRQSIEPLVNPQPLVPVDGDMLLMCNEDFYENVSEKSIQKILDDQMPVVNKIYRLADMAVANGAQGSASLQLVSFYNLDHQERSFVAAQPRKTTKVRAASEKDDEPTAPTGTHMEKIQAYLQIPWVRILLVGIAIMALSYMFYDMFIREPRPSREIRTVREVPVVEEADQPELQQPTTAPPAVKLPEDRAYTVQSGDTWGRIYTRFGVCSWFIRNHPPNAGKFDADENPVAGSRLLIPVVYSAKRDLNPDFYQEFSLEKTGSRCENASADFLEQFRRNKLR